MRHGDLLHSICTDINNICFLSPSCFESMFVIHLRAYDSLFKKVNENNTRGSTSFQSLMNASKWLAIKKGTDTSKWSTLASRFNMKSYAFMKSSAVLRFIIRLLLLNLTWFSLSLVFLRFIDLKAVLLMIWNIITFLWDINTERPAVVC